MSRTTDSADLWKPKVLVDDWIEPHPIIHLSEVHLFTQSTLVLISTSTVFLIIGRTICCCSIMSSSATFISGPSSLAHLRKAKKGATFHNLKTQFISSGILKESPNSLLLMIGRSRKSPPFHPNRPIFCPVMEWQDCRAEIEVDVPASAAFDCYSDRERIPEWMPFISSVKVLKDKPELSRWSLKYEVLGQNVEFSWLARNMQPTRNQKIHWRSLDGLPNKGAVRFFPKGPSSCRVELTVSYEVPDILTPVASALKPFTESLLLRGLERFATVARKYQEEVPQS